MTNNLLRPGRVLWIVGAGLAISLLGDATLYIVLPTDFEKAGLLAGHVGLMLSANRLIRVFLNTPYGILIERLPRRRMLIPSLLLGGVSSLLYTFPGFLPMLAGRVLWGTAWSGLLLGCTSAILDVATDERRGQLIGGLQMWFLVGVGGSSLLGGLLYDALGFRPTFYLSAFISTAGALLWWFFLPETSHLKQPVREVPGVLESSSEPLPPAEKRLPASVPLPALAAAIMLHALNWLILIGILRSVLPVLLKERVGVEIAVLGLVTFKLAGFTGVLSSFNTLIGMANSPLSGWITDRLGNRWLLVAMGVALAITALSMTAVGQGNTIIFATMINAVVTSTMATQLTAIIGDFARQSEKRASRQGRTLGIMNTAGDLGGALGPLIAFGLLPTIGLQAILGVSALVMTAVFPLILWITWRTAASTRAR